MKTRKNDKACPIFKKHEATINKFIDGVNKSKEISEKDSRAEEVMEKASVLLHCVEYDRSTPDCKDCQTIADILLFTVELMINARNKIPTMPALPYPGRGMNEEISWLNDR